MPDAKSRARVLRLLKTDGEFRPDDIMNLFLFARDHCDGRETVSDIGSFVAHHTERNKGLVTQSTRKWAIAAHYVLALASAQTVDRQRLPTSAREYFRIAANYLGYRSTRKKAGLKLSDAHTRLNKIADELKINNDGTWLLSQNIDNDDAVLLQAVSTVLLVKPAFKPETLSRDFINTLKSNGLITKDEIIKDAGRLGMSANLFAISVMHNCHILTESGEAIKLKARCDGGEIGVFATVKVPSRYGEPVGVAASMYSMALDPNAYCTSDLLTTRTWDFEIEMNRDGLLARL